MNFGDEIGPYLFTKIAGRNPVFTHPSDFSPNTVYATVGSILEHIRGNCVVWGSGVIQRTSFFARPQRVCAVRGPISRQRFLDLGYPCPAVFGDPAVLLPRFYFPDASKTCEVGVTPNYSEYELACSRFAGLSGVKIIDLRESVENVVLEILQCETVLSSSLHGCIVSHAYGIPAVWIKLSARLSGDGSKFLDYYQTIGVDAIDPIDLQDGRLSQSTLSSLRSASALPSDWPNTEELLAACPFKQ